MGGIPNQPERDGERVVLGRREARHELEERSTELLSRGERELHLRLDSRHLRDPESAPSLGRVLEEGRLADAGFAMHHQYAATAAARAVQESVEHPAFAFAAEQLPSRGENRLRHFAHPRLSMTEATIG